MQLFSTITITRQKRQKYLSGYFQPNGCKNTNIRRKGAVDRVSLHLKEKKEIIHTLTGGYIKVEHLNFIL